MSKSTIRVLFSFAFLFISARELAAEEFRKYEIENTEVREIKSSVNGKKYDLYISLPSSYKKSSKAYPVAFLNDTSFSFPMASGLVKLLGGSDIEEVVLVGISYSKGDDAGVSRTRDYTPTFAPDETSYHSIAAKKASGQAHNYIDFLSKDVVPFVSEKYRIDSSREIFVGHSFGGLLGSYILLKNPELFDYYIIGSPSFWYDNKVIFSLEEAYAENSKSMRANVLMYVGDSEDTEDHKMVADIKRFESVLKARNYSGLDLKVDILKGATHQSAFSILLQKALMEIL